MTLSRGARAACVLSVPVAFCAVLSLPSPASAAAAACAGSHGPVLALSIVSGALRGAEHERLRVSVFENGCVAVQRPWYLREAGLYELHLDAAEMAALGRQVDANRLRAVSEDSLHKERQQARAAEKAAEQSAGEASVVEYYDPDGDRFVLQWRDGGVLRQLAWRSVLDDAARHPKSAGLNAFADAVRALQPLLRRHGRRVDGGASR